MSRKIITVVNILKEHFDVVVKRGISIFFLGKVAAIGLRVIMEHEMEFFQDVVRFSHF